MTRPLAQQRLMFDYVDDYRKYLQARAQETAHMCGLQGFNPMLGDSCPKCDLQFFDRIAVDPDKMRMYAPNHHISELRSKNMDTCDYCGEEGHWEEECEELAYDEEGLDRETYNIQDFLGKLETFLVDELDEECRGNVFLSETGENSVAINILVGAPFEGSGLDTTCSQINVIIAPTDRSLLGSEGVTIHDNVDRPEEETLETTTETREETHGWFDRAMSIFR